MIMEIMKRSIPLMKEGVRSLTCINQYNKLTMMSRLLVGKEVPMHSK